MTRKILKRLWAFAEQRGPGYPGTTTNLHIFWIPPPPSPPTKIKPPKKCAESKFHPPPSPPPQQKLSYHLRHLNRNLKSGVPPKGAVLFRCVQRNCNTNRAITKSARGLIFLIFSFDLEMTIYVSRGSINIKQNDQHTTIKQIRGHLANHSHRI